MKDFKSFTKGTKQNSNFNGSAEFEKNANDFLNKRKNSSEKDLMDEFQKRLTESKKDGTFDLEKIQSFAKQITPFLDNQQKQRLNELLKLL